MDADNFSPLVRVGPPAGDPRPVRVVVLFEYRKGRWGTGTFVARSEDEARTLTAVMAAARGWLNYEMGVRDE